MRVILLVARAKDRYAQKCTRFYLAEVRTINRTKERVECVPSRTWQGSRCPQDFVGALPCWSNSGGSFRRFFPCDAASNVRMATMDHSFVWSQDWTRRTDSPFGS